MRIAFTAPLKAPDHPVPSGDRAMARALVRALTDAGHAVEQPSRLRSFLAVPDALRQHALMTEADHIAEGIAAEWAGNPPDLWLTYHNHYKAPDLLGPLLSARFGLPYAIAEASHAPKRRPAWGAWHDAAEAASRAADLHICFTTRDREGLAPVLKPGAAVLDLPPFLDLAALPEPGPTDPSAVLRLLVVAMMRPGDKLASYGFLATALAAVDDLAWHLTIVGDGPARAEVAQAFAPLPGERLTWAGELAPEAVPRCMADADIFVWPGIGEAFGLAYLEAQAMGLPVVAFHTAGVPSVVRNGETGLLVHPMTAQAFAASLRTLLHNRDLRQTMGAAAHRFVRSERSLTTAAGRLDDAMQALRERRHA